MATDLRLTLTEVAGSINRQFGHEVPAWKLRRVVDPLESDNRLDVQRVANYRTVSDGDLGVVATELRRIGWLSRGVAKCS